MPSLWRSAGGEGPGAQVSEPGSEDVAEAAAPWESHFSDLSYFCLSVCTDVRSSHRLPLGRRQERNWESGVALVLLVELDFDWV